jgi:hypothetical protein
MDLGCTGSSPVDSPAPQAPVPDLDPRSDDLGPRVSRSSKYEAKAPAGHALPILDGLSPARRG